MNSIYTIPLLPLITRLQELEEKRAANARKRTRVRKIPTSFLSVNRMYPIARGGRGKRLSTEGREYKKYIAECMTKQDEPRDVDLSNMFKAAEDGIFEHLMESDSRVSHIVGYKRLTEEEPKLFVVLTEDDPHKPVQWNDLLFSVEDLCAL